MDEAQYREALERQRKEKDRFFGTHPHSPVPEEERKGFQGLRYFPPDPAYRVRATWAPAAAPKTVRMGTSTGEMKDYVEAGTLHFEIDGTAVTLRGYLNPEHPHGGLFVPFRDATSGKETYGAARYVEAEEPHHGETVIDFNLAYNPFCAYAEDYTCPLPPRENWLSVPIRAGERTYKDE